MRSYIHDLRVVISLSIVLSVLMLANSLYAWTGPTATPPSSNAATPINTSSTAQVKTGGLWVNSLGSDGEIVSTMSSGYGQFRMVNGNYGAFWRNDGSNTYFLLTNSGDQYGQWNGLRPLYINDSSGAVNVNTSLCLNGNCQSSWPSSGGHSSGHAVYACPTIASYSHYSTSCPVSTCIGQYQQGSTCHYVTGSYQSSGGGGGITCYAPTTANCTYLGNLSVF